MYKKIILIIFLVIINIILYKYMVDIESQRHAFTIPNLHNPLLIQTKDIELYDINEFSFEDYFLIVDNNNSSYKYDFNDENINIYLNEKEYSYLYKILEKEKELVEIEKVIYVETYIESNTNHSQSSANDDYDYYYEDSYLDISNDYLVFSVGTSLNEIINSINNCISTNQRVSVDYSNLNPNYVGSYEVYILGESQNSSIIVEIL